MRLRSCCSKLYQIERGYNLGVSATLSPPSQIEAIAEKVLAGQRLSFDDGLALFSHPNLIDLSSLAHHRRMALNPQPVVTYVIGRIIGMSGKLTDGQIQGMKTSGFDGFLKKPFQVRQLVDAIEAATNLVA